MNKVVAIFSKNGWRIPWFGSSTGRSAIRSSDANDLVQAVNALGNMQIPGGKVTYSDGKIILEPGAGTGSGGSVTPATGLPFQIQLMDTEDGRTIQVSDGKVFVSKIAGTNSYIPGGIDPEGTETDITFPDVAAYYYIWLKIYDPGTGWIAEVQTGDGTPFDWVEFPGPRGFDTAYYTPKVTGYVLLGVFNSLADPSEIIQYMFCNPVMIDSTSSLASIPASSGIPFGIEWQFGSAYRLWTICTYSGDQYARTATSFGDNGGTPTGTPGVDTDWFPIN